MILKEVLQDILYKRVLNRESTDVNYDYYNEENIFTDVFSEEVWVDDIPETPDVAVAQGVAELVETVATLAPTPTNSNPNRKYTTYIFLTNDNKRIRNFIPPVFSPHYTVQVYLNGSLLPPNLFFFDYTAGILYIFSAISQDYLVTIKAYKYKGKKLKDYIQALKQLDYVYSEILNFTQLLELLRNLHYKVYKQTITPDNKTVTPNFQLQQNKFLVYDNGLLVNSNNYTFDQTSNSIIINYTIRTEHIITIISLDV